MTDNQVTIRKLISSTSSDYEVQEFLGCGAYGAVTKCRKVATNEMVALKILKRTDYIDFAKEEAETLAWMKQLNSEKFNIVVLNDSFTFEGRFHLEFEKLDISLCQFMEMRSSDSLQLQEIRPIVQQLATALEFIKHAGVVHADLKPANIMMVDHVRQPLRIKIIDFGIACRDPEARTGQILQTLWYRSPEILLGAPFNTAIDTWSLGCIAAEMKLGKVLFPGSDEYDMLRYIIYTIGHPPAHLLCNGVHTKLYFCGGYRGPWRFMSTCEIGKSNCVRHTILGLDFFLRALHDLPEEDAGADECDLANFVDLLKKMLTVDSSERITPSQILQHPFITMSHLVGTFDNSPHVKSSVELMKYCNVLSSDDGKETTSNSPALHPDEGHAAGQSEEEQLGLQSIHENSPAKKRKRDCSEDSESGNRSPIATKRRRRRNQCQDTADTVRQTHPLLRKRRRDESDQRSSSDSNSQETKKRRINFDKELMDRVTELLSDTQEAPSSSTQVQCLSSGVKSSVELMKYCDVLGHAAGQSEEEQLGLQSIHENSPAKKRKRDCSEDSESGNRSPIATKSRSQCQDAADTVQQTRPLLRKRQRDESDQRSSTDSNSQKTKQRRINLDKEPTDSVTKLQSDTQEAPSSSTQVQRLSSSVKSSVELMKYCNVLSSDDGKETTSNSPALHPDEGHAAGQSEEEPLGLQSIHENSPAKKRKRDCSEDSESGNRSPIATKRRSQCQDAADTVQQTRPLLRKRQRDESDQRSSTDSNSQKTKKSRINLDKEPMDRVTELLSNTQEAPSSSTQVQSLKRRRADEEATSPEEEKTSCPDKRRRRRRRGNSV